MPSSWAHTLVVVASLVGCGAAFVLLPVEYDSYLASNRPALDWYLAPQDIPQSIPHSIEGKYVALKSCDTSMADVTAQMMPADIKANVALACRKIASETIEQSPAMSLAYLTRSQAHFHLNEPEKALADLQRSEQIGGGLTWMAGRRIDIALRLIEQRSPDSEAALRRDIVRLLQSEAKDIQRIARRYKEFPQAREFIVAAVEKMPDSVQSRFLFAVRTGL